ncbi:MAG: hypothetical protein JWR16_2729 [Nevskia sp.]|nr:hypothetical protein [Nevskia sp.]
MSQIETFAVANWSPAPAAADDQRMIATLEAGKVLLLPRLSFELRSDERRFLDPRWSDRRAKNISYDPASAQIKGAIGNSADLEDLRRLLERFHLSAVGLIKNLFPAYGPQLRIARASFRPLPIAGRASSWRKDDSRLHVDAFPSRPNRGERILRVFANVNPNSVPRVWRVGEPFADLARRFLPKLPRQLPGSAALLNALHITKSPRSAYDHYMLHLHDAMKADLEYQQTAPQETVPFAAGCSWICFSDQTSHAAMSGQHLFEQTLHLPVSGLYDADSSPLRVLEKLSRRKLA